MEVHQRIHFRFTFYLICTTQLYVYVVNENKLNLLNKTQLKLKLL